MGKPQIFIYFILISNLFQLNFFLFDYALFKTVTNYFNTDINGGTFKSKFFKIVIVIRVRN